MIFVIYKKCKCDEAILKFTRVASPTPNRADVSKFAPLKAQDWRLKKIQDLIQDFSSPENPTQKSSGLLVTITKVVRG